MSDFPAKFASAFFLAAVAGAAPTALPSSPARAADNCLTEPNRDDTPQGKHWYFHIEHGTGRHCWYLRGMEEKGAARADTNDAPADKPAPRRTEAMASRAIADAHAEVTPRTRVPGDASPATPPAWPNPQVAAPAANGGNATATDASTPLAARWPQAVGTAPAAGQPSDASLMVADAATDPSAATDPTAQVAPPPSLAAAPAERNTGSLQKLLVVAAGALALAGLTGSAVYRLGRRRRRNDWLRERSNWQSTDDQLDPPQLDPPWVGRESAYAGPAVPDLDEARAAIARGEPAQESDAEGDRVEKIEDFLARLTEQLHQELESSRPHRA